MQPLHPCWAGCATHQLGQPQLPFLLAAELLAACKELDAERVRGLLRCGAPADYRDASSGRTALGHMFGYPMPGLLPIAAALLASGADPNIADSDGLTPLHLAAGRAHLEGVKLLLKAGADATAATADGDTPLHHYIPCAKYSTQCDLVLGGGALQVPVLLIAAGASPTAVNKRVWTPLGAAACACEAKPNLLDAILSSMDQQQLQQGGPGEGRKGMACGPGCWLLAASFCSNSLA